MTLCLATYHLILTHYVDIEDAKNLRIQKALAKSLKDYGSHVNKIIKEYANWDESYLFIEGDNPNFIEKNFRDSSTLEAFSLCTIQFLKKDFTPILRLDSKKNHNGEKLGEYLAKVPKRTHGGFLNVNGLIYYYYTHPVLNQKKSSTTNGFLQGAFELNKKSLVSYNVELKNVEFFPPKDWLNIKNKNILKVNDIDISVTTLKTEKNIENYFLIFDYQKIPVGGIKTTHERTMYLQGKKVILIFLIFIIGILIVSFILILYRHKELQNEKNRLELAVNERTKDLKLTLKELREAVKKLESIAYIDELTGIKTRRAFFEKTIPLLQDSFGKDKTLCIALIDLDDFKTINDTYGHEAGDIVLKNFCRACERFLDERMTFARFGGEEFVISFYGISVKHVEQICEKIQSFVGENPVTISKNTFASYTFSLGIACNNEAKDIDQILRIADSRLYGAKDGGKNLIRSR